ncbi:uncharacterized protein PHALS_02705 [Plasmopara halstedii]|uniref:Uncharacterized protein n=1 Tax=Plasmopara halstedii TaxID=4781 RepID=A0A0P1AZG8_PLAHL|nr:uncharacterized protein PHALS_02705 [Plasmopara halstedii]CEG46296.1 hypothetical protein PHALS_02705 [Plasmopara halstedii]|eukprot:XP_024582665.1 hypothetical protein PHALS_02705 [Plasmopara halstedii]
MIILGMNVVYCFIEWVTNPKAFVFLALRQLPSHIGTITRCSYVKLDVTKYQLRPTKIELCSRVNLLIKHVIRIVDKMC